MPRRLARLVLRRPGRAPVSLRSARACSKLSIPFCLSCRGRVSRRAPWEPPFRRLSTTPGLAPVEFHQTPRPWNKPALSGVYSSRSRTSKTGANKAIRTGNADQQTRNQFTAEAQGTGSQERAAHPPSGSFAPAVPLLLREMVMFEKAFLEKQKG